MKINLSTTIILLALLTNCVSTKIVPLNVDSSSIKDKAIIVKYDNEKPYFAAMTSTNMTLAALTGGIVGSIMMIHEGNKIIKENNINDPAIFIADNLADHLKSKYGVRIIKIDHAANNSADYAIDVKTVDWSFGYLPFKTDSFRVLYSAKLQMIDLKNSKVIAEGFCSDDSSAENKNNLPSYRQLLDNKAKILKEELSQSSQRCLNLFKEKVFNLSANDSIKSPQ